MEIIESEIEIEPQPILVEEKKEKDVCVIIFKVNNNMFNLNQKPYDMQLFGKKVVDYVSNSVFDAEIKYVECDFKEDVLQKIKQNVDAEYKYTVVLFSDTPLFRRKTYLQIMEYFEVKKMLGLKLTRGYVFQTSYLMTLDNLNELQMQYFEEEDFITCSNLKQFAMINDILKNRILDFFMKKGVVIKDPASTFIDAEVDIAPNVVIEPFNIIQGKTFIEQGVYLKSGNKLEDVIVCENSILDGIIAKNSFIGKNCYISNGVTLQNKTKICDEVKVLPYSNFDGVVVEKSDKLASFINYVAKEN